MKHDTITCRNIVLLFVLIVLISLVLFHNVTTIWETYALRSVVRCQSQINRLRDFMKEIELQDVNLRQAMESFPDPEILKDPFSGKWLHILEESGNFLILSVGPNGDLDTEILSNPMTYAPTNGIRSSNGDIWASSEEESIDVDSFGGWYRT